MARPRVGKVGKSHQDSFLRLVSGNYDRTALVASRLFRVWQVPPAYATAAQQETLDWKEQTGNMGKCEAFFVGQQEGTAKAGQVQTTW